MHSPAPISDGFIESCGPRGACVGCRQLGHYCAELGAAIGCAELVALDGFDETDRPSAGTGCAACARAGHWCPAKGMCGEYSLCLACGRGQICEQAKSVEKMRAGGEEFELEEGYSIPECRTIAIADADRVVTEVAPVTAWAIKASLDPENLRKGLTGSQRAPLKPPTPRFVRVARPVTRVESMQRYRSRKKEKPEEVAMTTETKKTRKPTPELGDITFSAVAPNEVPDSRWGKGIRSPFQPVYDKMFEAFAGGHALRLDLASGDIATTVGKAAQARAKRDGIKVRVAVEGATLWLLAVKVEAVAAAS